MRLREKSELLDLAARANVTISALDARGLYTTNLDASERGGDSALDLMTGRSLEYHSDSMNVAEHVMAEFANRSGGKFFHNSNDLEGGFKELTQAAEYVYLLQMSLQGIKADGIFCAAGGEAEEVRLDWGTLSGRRTPQWLAICAATCARTPSHSACRGRQSAP